MLRYLPLLLVLALWIYAFIDCVNTPEKEVRGLPKVIWVIIILLFGEVMVGPIAWLVAGKVRHAPAAGGPVAAGPAASTWVAPDDNPEFLKSLKDEKAEETAEDGERLLKDWEEDLRRREEDLKRRDSDEDPKTD